LSFVVCFPPSSPLKLVPDITIPKPEEPWHPAEAAAAAEEAALQFQLRQPVQRKRSIRRQILHRVHLHQCRHAVLVASRAGPVEPCKEEESRGQGGLDGVGVWACGCDAYGVSTGIYLFVSREWDGESVGIPALLWAGNDARERSVH
jgi:hypothetical protein